MSTDTPRTLAPRPSNNFSAAAAVFGLTLAFGRQEAATLWFGIPLLVGLCVRLRGRLVPLAMLAGAGGEFLAAMQWPLPAAFVAQMATSSAHP